MITITPGLGPQSAGLFRAKANGHQALGRTAGEALDGLREHLPAADGTTVVLVQKPARTRASAPRKLSG